MRIQRNMTGTTARMTDSDRGALVRELGILVENNTLIKGGVLDQLYTALVMQSVSGAGEVSVTDHPGVPASMYIPK